jgi:hypothetical protein
MEAVMHSVIFVATMPDQNADWSMFLGALAPKAKRAKGVERLAENVWVINVRCQDASLLGWLISLCDQKGIPFRMLPLERAPEWLPVAADSKPT